MNMFCGRWIYIYIWYVYININVYIKSKTIYHITCTTTYWQTMIVPSFFPTCIFASAPTHWRVYPHKGTLCFSGSTWFPSLKLTASLPLKIGLNSPRLRKFHRIPNIHFQDVWTVSFREVVYFESRVKTNPLINGRNINGSKWVYNFITQLLPGIPSKTDGVKSGSKEPSFISQETEAKLIAPSGCPSTMDSTWKDWTSWNLVFFKVVLICLLNVGLDVVVSFHFVFRKNVLRKISTYLFV